MVHIALEIKADMESVTSLTPEGEDFRWYLKLKCLNCGEESKAFVYLTLIDSVPLKGGRGHASVVSKCKLCSRENSIDIVKDSYKPYNLEDSGKFKKIAQFECRGMEPTDFSPRGGWVANGAESASKFDVDLTEKEWYDFDERSSNPVSIVEFQYKFSRA
ncbi:UPF0587 protein v1g245604-like isoform X3 [Rhopilema esculentum]|uniref:UPF0587 protein v1g245604-like isoform X2 n=1 Tax=Rhopilema esculentum TaxID=499914 RepID=UPI0031E0AC7B